MLEKIKIAPQKVYNAILHYGAFLKTFVTNAEIYMFCLKYLCSSKYNA